MSTTGGSNFSNTSSTNPDEITMIFTYCKFCGSKFIVDSDSTIDYCTRCDLDGNSG